MKTKPKKLPAEPAVDQAPQPFLIALFLMYVELIEQTVPNLDWSKGGITLKVRVGGCRNDISINSHVRLEVIVSGVGSDSLWRALQDNFRGRTFKTPPISCHGAKVLEFLDHHSFYKTCWIIPILSLPNSFIRMRRALNKENLTLEKTEGALRKHRLDYSKVNDASRKLRSVLKNASLNYIVEGHLVRIAGEINELSERKRKLKATIRGHKCLTNTLAMLGLSKELRKLLRKHKSTMFITYEADEKALIKKDVTFGIQPDRIVG